MLFLLAEPHALTREGLKRIALDADAANEFVEAVDSAQATTALGLPLDAMVFDATLLTPEQVFALRQSRPQWVLIALIARDDQAAVRRLSAGMDALVPKAATTEVLAAALRLAMGGGDVHVRGRAPLPPQPAPTLQEAYALRRGTGSLNLTSRQYDVLALVAQDCSNKAIGAALGIGVRTVKGHVSVILRALHADNRIDAGRSARKWLARAGGCR